MLNTPFENDILLFQKKKNDILFGPSHLQN